ncbi:Type 1 glutamine amidotransferase-like domain-containing protein [Providencia rettgeri]|nr:Type 1 glutamine amidotransferase-like domain-containing protein [Providencia rettgeri]
MNICPFQINPHFISGKPIGHNGESREERLNEFLTINPMEELIALYEGTALFIENDHGTILGEQNALWLREPNKIEEIATNKPFKLNIIKGVQ